MNLSLRLASWRVLAAGLVVVLGGFGLSTLQAQDHSCPSKTCPAPVVREKPKAPACCAPVVLEKPQVPPAETCCPVDPKDVKKAQKEAEHAQHEAAEACKRQQKAVAKAQHELEEEQAKQQAKIDNADAKVQQRTSEMSEANAKLESLNAPSECCAVAEATPQAQPEVARALPEPIVQPAPEPAPVIENNEIAVIEPAPTPAPEPTPEPAQLPKTASPMNLIGLIGLASMAGSYIRRSFRR